MLPDCPPPADLLTALASPPPCAHAALAPRAACALAPPDTPPPPPGAAKQTRDTYGAASARSSENFTLRWGSGINDRDADDALAILEAIWSAEVEAMGFPAPPTTDAWTLNVYIGDTGDGVPSSYGYGGYYTRDDEGYPMIVLDQSAIWDPSRLRVTGSHEFFHAVQDATDVYDRAGAGAWYYEATACWMSGEVYPDEPGYADFLFGYSFLPHLPIDHHAPFTIGALEEYHPYGAFIFPRYLSEKVADAALIRDSWTLAQSDDPLVELERLLAAQGHDIATLFAEFAVSNVPWDYEDGATYIAADAAGAEDFDSLRESATHWGETDGWQGAPADSLPQRFGADYAVVRAPSGGVSVEFEGDEGAGWSAWAVVVGSGGYEAIEVPLEDGAGAVSVDAGDLIEDVEAIWVVAAVLEGADGEDFGWRYRVEAIEGGVDTGEEVETPEGCGCAAARGVGGAWWVVALVGWRRRR